MQQKTIDQSYMKERPVLPLLLSMSLPMVISMMVNSLYNIVDSFFVAKISENAMTALSLVYPIQNLIVAISVGFGVGMNAVISYELGAEHPEHANKAASLGMFLSVIHAVVLLVSCISFMPVFLGMFTSDSVLIDLGLRYSRIVFSFSIITIVGISFEKFFQAMGRMKVAMTSLMSGCITNIILDPILIFGLGPAPALGIEGAALATGLGQTVSLTIYLCCYFRMRLPVRICRFRLSQAGPMALRLYGIGVPAMLNLALPSLLISSLNGILAGFSQTYILILGIYYKLQTFLYLPANGIVQGMRPLIGYNYGAKEYGRVKSLYRLTLLLDGLMMAAGTLVCLLIPGWLIGLFTTVPETIAAGSTALRFICLGFLASTISVASSGALEGLGKGVPSLWISLFRYLLLMIPAAFLLSRLLGPNGVWLAFPVTELLTAAISWAIYHRSVRF